MSLPRELLERQLAIREELLRRQKDDPWYQFVPTHKQEPFIKAVLLDEIEEAWFIAANRSGKTDAACFCGSSLARFGRKNPRYQISFGGNLVVEDYATSGMVISVDYPNSRDVVQPKYFDNGFAAAQQRKPFIPAHEIAENGWSVTNQTLRLRNGSIIAYKSADNKAIKVAGSERDWVQFDEETAKTLYEEATIRVGAGKRLKVFGAATILPPEGMVGGVSWLYTDIIKPFQSGRLSKVRVFGSSIYDNPHILPEEIARLEAKYPPGSPQRAIRLEGQYLPGLQGARAYGNFNALHHVKKLGELLPRVPIAWMWDFNVEPLITLVGQRVRDTFRVHKELVLDEGGVDDMCQKFIEEIDYQGREVLVYGDATGKHRDATGPGGRSDYQIIANIMRAHRCSLRMKVPEANPHVPNRVSAVNYALRDENGINHIEIDEGCVELIDDMEGVLTSPNGGIKKTNNRRDPYSRRTHSSDSLGYWISYEAPVKSNTFAEKVMQTIRNPGYRFGNRSAG